MKKTTAILLLLFPLVMLWSQDVEIIALPDESPEILALIRRAVGTEAGERPVKVWFRPRGNFYNVKIALHPGKDETAVYKRLPIERDTAGLASSLSAMGREAREEREAREAREKLEKVRGEYVFVEGVASRWAAPRVIRTRSRCTG